jgi:hypothetical protein
MSVCERTGCKFFQIKIDPTDASYFAGQGEWVATPGDKGDFIMVRESSERFQGRGVLISRTAGVRFVLESDGQARVLGPRS